MHWYVYNNTISLLNIIKSRIFHPVHNFKTSKLSTILSASQPAIKPGSTMAPDLHKRKVTMSSLQNCYYEEVPSTVPSFYPSLLSFLFYSLIKGEKLSKEVSIDCNSFWLHHTKTTACTHKHNYETSLSITGKMFSSVLLYILSFKIARLHVWTNRFSINNTAALPGKLYC